MATLQRALKYRLADIERVTRILYQLMQQGLYYLPEIALKSDYEEREAYQEGRFSREEDLAFSTHQEEEDRST